MMLFEWRFRLPAPKPNKASHFLSTVIRRRSHSRIFLVQEQGPILFDGHQLRSYAIEIAQDSIPVPVAERRQPHQLILAPVDLEPAIISEAEYSRPANEGIQLF